jgi:hypothetical protein
MSVGNILTMLTMFLALAGGYANLSAETADLKRRVTTVEQRNTETRKEIKEVANEIKVDVKETKSDVQLILRKLDTMEAVNRAERTRERRQ